MTTCFEQKASEETQEKISLMEMISTKKGRKSLSKLFQNAKSASKRHKKAFRDQKKNFTSNFKYNSKTLRWQEYLVNFFSSKFVKERDWTWMLREEEISNTKHLKINITKENLQKRWLTLNPNKSSGPDSIHSSLRNSTSNFKATANYF